MQQLSLQYRFYVPNTLNLKACHSSLQAEIGRVRAERAAEAAAAAAAMESLQRQQAASQDFVERRVLLEGELAAVKAQLADRQREGDQRLR
jgi:uncharacterized small protein (DUF1192 family)